MLDPERTAAKVAVQMTNLNCFMATQGSGPTHFLQQERHSRGRRKERRAREPATFIKTSEIGEDGEVLIDMDAQ